MIPPFKEHRLAYEFKPWRELQFRIREHVLELILTDVSRILDLVLVDVERNFVDWFDKKNIVN